MSILSLPNDIIWKVQILRFENKDVAAEKAGEKLHSLLAENKEYSIFLLLSGGSAREILKFVSEESLGPHVTITVLDERYSRDPSINNFCQLMGTEFYNKAVLAQCSFIDTRVEDRDTLGNFALRFEISLRKWIKENTNGVVIATLGMGADGHTAGIMPFPENPEKFAELFETSDKWVAGYDAENKNPYRLRVTTTMTFLKEHVDYGVAYICGSDKKKAFKEMLTDGLISEIPARVLRQMKSVTIFTDLHIS